MRVGWHGMNGGTRAGRRGMSGGMNEGLGVMV